MSTSDTLMFLQTLMALATCVLLLYYIIVTGKLQRQSQEQNLLQKEQLEVARQELSQALGRERKLLMPYFRWRGGTSGANEEKWEFENLGADICNIRWSAPPDLDLEFSPRHLIRTFDAGSIQLNSQAEQIQYPLRFSLAFTNRFGEACTRNFEVSGPGTEPKEVMSSYQA
jgi:hypothetical protein